MGKAGRTARANQEWKLGHERGMIVGRLRTSIPILGDEMLELESVRPNVVQILLPNLSNQTQLSALLFNFHTFQRSADLWRGGCNDRDRPPGGMERGMGDTNHCPAAPFFLSTP